MPVDTRPAVSIVVPFFDSEEHIETCIQSLLQQEPVDAPYQVILVNNGSTDRSVSIAARHDRVLLLDEPTPGAYAARNTGLAAATAPVIAFTDADCVVAPDWLRSIREGMQDPAVAILVGRCLFPSHASPALRLLGAYENAKTEYVLNHCTPSQRFAYANNMAVRASVFEDLGTFEEWQRAADSELVHRLASARPDLRVAYQHAMIVTHLEFVSSRARVRRLSLYSRTNAQITGFAELGLGDRAGVVRQMLRRWRDPE